MTPKAGAGWKTYEISKALNYYNTPLNPRSGASSIRNYGLFGFGGFGCYGYSKHGQMPFEGELTAQARDKYCASYWDYQSDVLDDMKDRLTFWGGIKGGFKDFFSSPQGAMTTLAIGGGILGKMFGNIGDIFSGNNQNNCC